MEGEKINPPGNDCGMFYEIRQRGKIYLNKLEVGSVMNLGGGVARRFIMSRAREEVQFQFV